MDWKRTMTKERAKRIVALLIALADLAERASRRSPAVRGFVLWVLFQAEVVARDLVTGVLAQRRYATAFATMSGCWPITLT